MHSTWLFHQTGRQSTFSKSTLIVAAPPVPYWKTVHSARVHSSWLLHRYQTGRQSTFSKSTLRALLLHQTGRQYIQQEYTQRGCSSSTRLEDRVHSARVHSAWLLDQTGRQYIQQEYTHRGCSTGTRLEDRVHSARVHSERCCSTRLEDSTFSKSTLSVAAPPDWKTEYIQQEYTQRGCSTRLEDRIHSTRVNSAWLLHRYQTGRQYIQQKITQRGCSTRLETKQKNIQRGYCTSLKDEYIQQEYTQRGFSTKLDDRVHSP